MTARRTWPVLLVLAVLLGAGAWWIRGSRSEARAESVRAGASARPSGRADGAPLAAAPDVATGSRDEGSDRASVAAPAPVPAPAAAADDGAFEETALYGRVTDRALRPIAGARCLVFPASTIPGEDAATALHERATDAAGRFRVRELDALSEHILYVEAAGYLPELATLTTGRDAEVLLTEAAPIAGRVTDAAGRPAAGVRVSLQQAVVDAEGRLLDEETSTTDAEGRYALAYARADRVQRVRLARAAAADVPALREERRFQVQAGRTDGYDLVLGDARVVELSFYDVETGKPVGGTSIELGGGLAVVPDARGIARVAAADFADDGAPRIDVRLAGYCRTLRTPTRGDLERGRIEVPLHRGARVTVRARDEDGAPVAGARVSISTAQRQLRSSDLPPNTRITTRGGSAVADADGLCELDGVLPSDGEQHVFAIAAGLRSARSEPLHLPNGAATRAVELVLARGGAIEGFVRRNGEPARARVWWNHSAGVSGGGVTNDAGRYALSGVDPGRVELTFVVGENRTFGSGAHREQVVVEAGATTRKDVDLVESRATIAGRVREPDGTPLAGIEVRGWGELESEGLWSEVRARTEPDGTFELEVSDRPGLTYDVSVSQGERSARLDDVPIGTRDLDVVLPRSAAVALAVVDALSGEPIDRFRLYRRESGGERGFQSLSAGGRDLWPGPDGVFAAELPIGVHDLRIAARDGGYLPADVAELRVTDAPREAPVRVALERGVTLEIRFHGPPGESERRVQVTPVLDAQRAELERGLDAFTRREVRDPQRARPDSEGKAVLHAMAPGRYTLWQPARDLVFEPASFEVPHVDRHVVDLTWRLAPGADAPGVEVSLQGQGYVGDG